MSLHRALFRQRAKKQVVHVTDRILQFIMVGVALTLARTGMLIFDFVLGRVRGIVAGAGILVVIVVLWIVVPRVVGHNRHIEPRA